MQSEELQNKIKKVEERRQKASAQLIKLKAMQKKKERSIDTRKKILIGSMMLAEMNRSPEMNEKIIARLDKYLTKQIDRDLFAL